MAKFTHDLFGEIILDDIPNFTKGDRVYVHGWDKENKVMEVSHLHHDVPQPRRFEVPFHAVELELDFN